MQKFRQPNTPETLVVRANTLQDRCQNTWSIYSHSSVYTYKSRHARTHRHKHRPTSILHHITYQKDFRKRSMRRLLFF